MTEENRSVERLCSRVPGTDSDDPYEDVDISELPEWWQRAIEEFDAHGLQNYRPPRFEDGSLTHEVVEELEHEHGVEMTFGSVESNFRERGPCASTASRSAWSGDGVHLMGTQCTK